jgi:hypothetical protein
VPAIEETTWAQIERILKSDTFQQADALRRLLRYLAGKSLSGEADQLKEYAIGVDAFGKPPPYDPRHDSIVRLQAGRLRQKLAEYYRTEGKDDTVIVELPKGHLKLSCDVRMEAPPPPPEPQFNTTPPPAKTQWRMAFVIASAVLAVCVVFSVYLAIDPWNEKRSASGRLRPGWTPELEQLWHPFVATNWPLIVAIEDPLFVELKGTETY